MEKKKGFLILKPVIVVLFFKSKLLFFQDIEHEYSDKQRIDEQ